MEQRDDTVTQLEQHAAERDALLDRIVQALESDSRVVAAWLSGSFGRGEADEWSDFDLHIAVTDDGYSSFLEDRPRLYQEVGQPVLIQPDMASYTVVGGRYQLVLYSGCHHVDWNIGPLSQARKTGAFQMLLERAEVAAETPPPLTPDQRRAQINRWLIFFWAMAPIAIKYAARSETRRAVSQIDLLTTALIALWRLANDPGGPDPWQPNTNRPLSPSWMRVCHGWVHGSISNRHWM